MKKVTMKIYAGGGWEGHVVIKAKHPTDAELYNLGNTLIEARDFCIKHDLEPDTEFETLLKEKLVFTQDYGGILIIPLEHLTEHAPISSASTFLKREFAEYYGD